MYSRVPCANRAASCFPERLTPLSSCVRESAQRSPHDFRKEIAKLLNLFEPDVQSHRRVPEVVLRVLNSAYDFIAVSLRFTETFIPICTYVYVVSLKFGLFW